jgi:hypothetical protein
MANNRPAPRCLVEVGQVLSIKEADYCYGVGDLRLRVTRVAPNQHPDVEWIRVVGMALRPDGSDFEPRDVLVRASALPTA